MTEWKWFGNTRCACTNLLGTRLCVSRMVTLPRSKTSDPSWRKKDGKNGDRLVITSRLVGIYIINESKRLGVFGITSFHRSLEQTLGTLVKATSVLTQV